MRRKIAVLMLLVGLGVTTSAFADDWGWNRNGDRERYDLRHDYRDIRHDHRDLHQDYQRVARDRWNGNWYAVQRDRRDIWNDQRDLRNDYRDVNRDRRW